MTYINYLNTPKTGNKVLTDEDKNNWSINAVINTALYKIFHINRRLNPLITFVVVAKAIVKQPGHTF
jgi:hypothetical protein